jgi:thiol-disulfide isomerase/thioredoxin
LLAALFLVAGLSKLGARARWVETVQALELPRRTATPVVVALPILELTIALLLAIDATVSAGAIAAIAFLSLLTVGVVNAVLRGRTPECNCFGQVASSRLGWGTVARNLLFVAVAVLVLSNPPFEPAGAAVLAVAAALALAVLGWFSLQLLRQNGRILSRLEALETHTGAAGPQPAPGSVAMPFVLPGVGGRFVSLADLVRPDETLLLAFVAPGCGPCEQLIPDLVRWKRERPELAIALIHAGGPPDPRQAEALGLDAELFQRDREVATAYGVQGTPAAVLISSDQRIASEVALGVEAIGALVNPGRPIPAPPHSSRLAALAGVAATGGALAVLAPAAGAQSDPEIEAIKAILTAAGPTVADDIDAVTNSLNKLAKSKTRRPSLHSVHDAVAGQIQHTLALRAQLSAAGATSAQAQAARDAAITSLDRLTLAVQEFDHMVGLRSKRKRKVSRKRASKLLEEAAAAGYYANVGLGCAGEGC